MNGTLALGAIGLITTFSAPIAQNLLASRSEKRSWQRDRRAAVYADGMAYAQQLETFIDRVLEPYFQSSLSRPVEPMDADLITARMRLLAPKHIFERWSLLRQAEDDFRWQLDQDFPAPGMDIPSDLKSLLHLQAAIRAFHEVLDGAL